MKTQRYSPTAAQEWTKVRQAMLTALRTACEDTGASIVQPKPEPKHYGPGIHRGHRHHDQDNV